MSNLINKDFTLISRDCIGGVIYHQLGLQFTSPTINLFFSLDDFNYFCRYLKKYIKAKLIEDKNENVEYPVGILKPKAILRKYKPVKVGFMHYDSFDFAKEKLDIRKRRINFKNIIVINSCCYSTETDTLNDAIIKSWNKIKYPKVILVNKPYRFNNEFVIKKPEECKEFAWLLYSRNKDDDSVRVFNDFDFINFINNKKM